MKLKMTKANESQPGFRRTGSMNVRERQQGWLMRSIKVSFGELMYELRLKRCRAGAESSLPRRSNSNRLPPCSLAMSLSRKLTHKISPSLPVSLGPPPSLAPGSLSSRPAQTLRGCVG
jgi:hypothetical protein